ncbi:hypothetical protein L9W73_16970 [Vibrio aestuarianus]|uniref:Uncharacterized protein n=1 Tax=Vibrio aestuarianus TaxID=28171 RepID=A0A9X4FN88_9VIBR|nr:hypothetical protein [Vibrio aestuarianus]MDE1312596.1 hypothetical protein [Vibrio aestuarianus]MDE1358976.1 hypothetical protein [Vibrio aestuarianus]NGZ93900.1 hypothetical protein [Vibrio aestuarianus subsp. cardii]
MNKEKIFVVVSGVGICASLALNYILISNKTIEEQAAFGSLFGASSALFSGFAFLGLIYTILLQRKELNLQRQELSLTRNELKKAAEAQEKSEVSLRKQANSLELAAKINGNASLLDALKVREGMYDFYEPNSQEHAAQQKIERIQLHHKMVEVQDRLEKILRES